MRDIALKYLKSNLNPVPVKVGGKEPACTNFNSEMMTVNKIASFDFDGIGIATGNISMGLELIDVDSKNAEDRNVFLKKFWGLIPTEIRSKLVIETTPSRGLHLWYRTLDVEPNKKLAENEEGDVLIETRGEGGYGKCYPSDGYELKQGSFDNITVLTSEERLQLMISCKMMDERIYQRAKKKLTKEENSYINKFQAFNEDENVGIDILIKHKWEIVGEDDVWISLRRPEKTGGRSAVYNKDGKFLFVFSTSSVFEDNKPYNNHAIYAELECDGRYDIAYAKLYEMGYGNEEESELNSSDFLATEEEEEGYLNQAMSGEVIQGLTTGYPELDKYFRFKEKHLVIGLGFDGVGKSLGMLNMALCSNILHGWKWGMVVPENKTAMSRRRLIELLTGKNITDFRSSRKDFKKWKDYTYENFHIVSNKKHSSIKEALEMGKILYEEKGITALLLDPYNFFRVDSQNGYQWNNDVLSQMRVFVQKYCTIYLMVHPNTGAGRGKLKDGELLAASPYESQGGSDFVYRCDDYFIWHRIKNHVDYNQRNINRFIVTKIKEHETGGREHSLDEYTELRYTTVHGFKGFFDCNNSNPLLEFMKSNSNYY